MNLRKDRFLAFFHFTPMLSHYDNLDFVHMNKVGRNCLSPIDIIKRRIDCDEVCER